MRKIGTITDYEIFEDIVKCTRYYGFGCIGDTTATLHCGYKYLAELLRYKGLKVSQIKWIPTKKQKSGSIGEYKRYYYQCDDGNRWSECEWEDEKAFYKKRGNAVSQDGSYCYFSGCKENDHKIKLIKVLDGNSEESNQFCYHWFKSIFRK